MPRRRIHNEADAANFLADCANRANQGLKEGSHFDLPIALGLLVAMGVLPEDEIAALGELTLDGRVNPVAGVLLAAMHALEHVNGNECHLMAKRGKA